MTSRERFIRAATHRKTDRAVFDLAGNPQTKIDYQITKDGLLEILGFQQASDYKRGNQSVDEQILTALLIDTRSVGGMPTPTTRNVREEAGIVYDAFGLGYKQVNGHFEICHNPLKDCTLSEFEAYEFPNPQNVSMQLIEAWANDAKWLFENTEYAIVAEHPVLGVFELGCWMLGFEDYLYRLLAEPEFVHAFSRRWVEYQKQIIKLYYGALGSYIQCTTSGDDFGTQKAQFMSTAVFDEMVAPYLKERICETKKYTDAFYQHHTCGAVFDLIKSLIDCGVDILNPIQPGVYKMEPERLKNTYGDKIAFWGGIDTQELLPKASPADVKKEVKRILSIMDRDGGYILSSAHTIQPDVPPENIAAIFQGAKEYYGI